jgi:hypothetical protein
MQGLEHGKSQLEADRGTCWRKTNGTDRKRIVYKGLRSINAMAKSVKETRFGFVKQGTIELVNSTVDFYLHIMKSVTVHLECHGR